MADLIHLIHQALPLPKGLIRQIMPEVIWQQRVYAYQLEVIVGQAGTLRIDARQLPISIPSLQGQYGDLGLYATSFAQVNPIAKPQGVLSARYLGEQLSLVFFDDLLTRYKALLRQNELSEELYPEEDGIPEFQDEYAERLEAYTPQGFMLGDYESAPMLRFPWGTVLLTPQAQEQVVAVVEPGGWVDVQVAEYSLACFKALQLPN
ncbi:MAG: hypothetical protein EOO39_08320 [Cytophagaceae bacterium]|nr:MAG: hypothetical protein EOO39_08320 [Cytophagaceae bacterium]